MLINIGRFLINEGNTSVQMVDYQQITDLQIYNSDLTFLTHIINITRPKVNGYK